MLKLTLAVTTRTFFASGVAAPPAPPCPPAPTASPLPPWPVMPPWWSPSPPPAPPVAEVDDEAGRGGPTPPPSTHAPSERTAAMAPTRRDFMPSPVSRPTQHGDCFIPLRIKLERAVRSRTAYGGAPIAARELPAILVACAAHRRFQYKAELEPLKKVALAAGSASSPRTTPACASTPSSDP